MRKLNTEEFIKKSIEEHGDKYDYSNVKYVNSKTKIKIICRKHGEFYQRVYDHCRGNGSPKCVGKNLSTNEIIKEFQKVHGNKYNYSKVIYKGIKKKIKVICHKHGKFLITPDSHKNNKNGCGLCGRESISKKLKDSQNDVIKKFQKIHGNRYDYSKVKYVNALTKIIIICRKHGVFQITPNSHISKKTGCSKCSGNYNFTNDEIIKQFKIVHGNRYDYSEVKYVSSHKKVKILCKVHGYFKQSPSHHKKGGNCPRCVGGVPLSQDEMINSFKKIHGNRYDYSKVKYVNALTKIIIICKKHGDFLIRPSIHNRGGGCYLCGREDVSRKAIRKTEDVIKDFKKIHGNKYDYSKVNYIGNDKYVTIICKIHGEFNQWPANHLMGSGCGKCAGKNRTTSEAIRNFKLIHENKYDYSKFKYITGSEKGVIICKQHGEFKSNYFNHVRGKGCSSCADYGYNPDKKGFLYLHWIFTDNNEAIKIGKTNNINQRLKILNLHIPQGIIVEYIHFKGNGYDVQNAEKNLKDNFKMGYLSPKELPDGYTETLPLDMCYDIEEYIENNFKNLNKKKGNSANKETLLKKYKD